MPQIPLNRLHAHPDNANRMPEALMTKLVSHLKASGRCPPLIVRPHPERAGHYQLIDGHHRAEALRRLGATEAPCDVWDVDDEQAALLLLTLNRLRGDDDPGRRGALIARLAESRSVKDLAKHLPDSSARIRKLLKLHEPPPMPRRPRQVDQLPHAVTFFLTGPQRRALFRKLSGVASDRSAALVKLLDLESSDAPSRGADS